MTAQIIDGKKIAQDIRADIKKDVDALRARGITPGLATVLVGNDPASAVYVKNKIKACNDAGIASFHHDLDAQIPEQKLLDLINQLNTDTKVHGILVQLPVPDHINAQKIICAISPDKDVDCFHPFNLGLFFSKKSWKEIEQEKLLLPCTPHGIIRLLKTSGIPIEGSHAVIVGRSNIVGKPLALMLMANNATVTICHSRTRDLASVCRQADILVAAIGKARFITADMVNQNAAVIDVGMNRTRDGLKGDVDFEAVKEKVKWITPVPRGVGPMTITMLLANTVLSAQRLISKQ
ncbi:MAG: bifunctional methylenetetrahydrofolate dehydrogenase/methenyltetrahydrofolate cyclohydrolase FolD [Elusimicrobia bacterium]|nr:bifunctional methylenetetrahydrofolate dehydrogenase/methenyltetrahydrofolate cyclohydrolase FolD [Elusimicrobiota bacterium]MBD3412727.1 bifunctional methylenetetrahydrofolate dehydrogenase/methenyltetrahydrofolate cyclohydrolase FolD [Elusimicrobiota bacterium]